MSELIIYPITLDMRRNLHQVIVMKENDANSRIIQAKITDNGKLYTLPPKDSSSDNYIAVKWHKPDGHVIYDIAYSLVDENTIEVICTDQMLCVAGIAEAEFVIYRNNLVVSTMKFNVSVDASVASNHMIESSNEFGLLNDLVTKNKGLRDSLEETFSEMENKIDEFDNTLTSHLSDKNNPHKVTLSKLGFDQVENKSSETIRSEITKNNVVTALGYTPYTPNEIDNKFSSFENNIDWKESVDTYNDISTKYPNPADGWTVNVKDTDYTYRFNGEEWITISTNAIPKATKDIDGLFTKENFEKLESIADNATSVSVETVVKEGTIIGIVNINGTKHSLCVPVNSSEIITESIDDEPLYQNEGECWIFEY